MSDWLTKLLVGATLTQLGRVPSAPGSLFTKIGSVISRTGESAAVVTGGQVIYAGVAGFIQGWMCGESVAALLQGLLVGIRNTPRSSPAPQASAIRPVGI
jgi:hypothetical protein